MNQSLSDILIPFINRNVIVLRTESVFFAKKWTLVRHGLIVPLTIASCLVFKDLQRIGRIRAVRWSILFSSPCTSKYFASLLPIISSQVLFRQVITYAIFKGTKGV